MKNIEKNILDVSNNDFNYLINLENVIGIGLGNKKKMELLQISHLFTF